MNNSVDNKPSLWRTKRSYRSNVNHAIETKSSFVHYRKETSKGLDQNTNINTDYALDTAIKNITGFQNTNIISEMQDVYNS